MCKCKTCGKTEIDAEFYLSIKTYCKEHWRQRVKENREANVDHYREFEKKRANNPDRVAARKAYAETEQGKKAASRARKSYEERNMEKVIAARNAYKQSEKGKAAARRYLDKLETKARFRDNRINYIANFPDRHAAHVKLGNAVRDGIVKPLPCFECGERAEAHHPDYEQPLEVVWLCHAHHKQAHALGRKLERNGKGPCQ